MLSIWSMLFGSGAPSAPLVFDPAYVVTPTSRSFLASASSRVFTISPATRNWSA